MDLDKGVGFHRLWHIYSEAIKSNCFIYDKNRKKWYTPEQFREFYDNGKLTDRFITNLLEDLVIRDPLAGLKAGQKQLVEKIDKFKNEVADELAKMSDFNKMALKYYQDNNKK